MARSPQVQAVLHGGLRLLILFVGNVIKQIEAAADKSTVKQKRGLPDQIV